MSPKSLFIIITKIFGLLLLLNILLIFPKFLNTIDFAIHSGSNAEIIYQLFFTVSIFFVYFLILRHILFKTGKVVEKLELDKGFQEEKFGMNFHKSDIIKVCIIIIGGFIFTQSIVSLILNIYLLIQSKYDFFGVAPLTTHQFNTLSFAHDILMVLIAYYFLTNYNSITNWIELKRRGTKNEPKNNEEE